MSNPKILLVDDDTQFLEATEYMLKYENYEVITAKNGEEAVKKYKETNPNIVLMDLKMPVLNGYDAFFKIKNDDKNAKIVFTSAYAITGGWVMSTGEISVGRFNIKVTALGDISMHC